MTKPALNAGHSFGKQSLFVFSIIGPSAYRMIIAAGTFKIEDRLHSVPKLYRPLTYLTVVSTMSTLISLPNEILTAIIEATEPDDIDSFSTCCKLIYSLARHRIEEHKEKKRFFSTLLVEDDISPLSWRLCDKKYDEPGAYLKEFLSDERNRLYPNAMIVYVFKNGFGPMDDNGTTRKPANDSLRYQLKRTMAGIYSAIGLDLGEDEAEEWAREVQAGCPIATFLLLLALLPNLKKITISVDSWSSTLDASYANILRHMTEAALGQNENGLGFGRRLSECKVYGEFFQSIGESLLPHLMMLPSIQKFRGANLHIEGGSWPYTDAVSPVVDLDLSGAIDTPSLSSYVRGTRELKRFRFIYFSDGYIPWVPCDIVAALKQFAFRTLVHLDITNNGKGKTSWSDVSPGIGSLRSFQVLKAVRLDHILLLREIRAADGADVVNPERKLKDLCDEPKIRGQELIYFLPYSARTFRLEDIAMGRLVLDIFEGFPEHRVERLPKLELISLDAVDEINTQIAEICKKSEVQMEVRQMNIPLF